jgi:acyl carrier protein
MTQAQISREEIDAVLPTVSATIADALGCDADEVTPDASLIDDLDAESIDFLDMVFRLERAFKVKIPRGKIVENARGTLTEAEFEQNGIVTDVGLKQLKDYLSEVPAGPLQDADQGQGQSRACSRRRRLQNSSLPRSASNEPPRSLRFAAPRGGAQAPFGRPCGDQGAHTLEYVAAPTRGPHRAPCGRPCGD